MARTLHTVCVLMVIIAVQLPKASSLLENQDDAKVVCPGAFFPIGDSCYYFSGEGPDEARTFAQAEDTCREMDGAGGEVELAVMGNDYAEFAVISDFVVTAGIERMFVGLRGPGFDGNWTWFDGTSLPLTSSMWRCSEPVHDCGGFIRDDYDLAPRVYLSSFDCNNDTASFLCELSPY